MPFKLSSIFWVPLMVITGACNAGETVTPTDQGKENYIKTSKPGAAVHLSHDYDGTALAGERRVITIQITDGYDSGSLKVDIVPNPNLVVDGAAGSYVFNMAGESTHVFSISVRALTEGAHYLNFNAVAEYGDRQVARTNSSIRLNAGVERKRTFWQVQDSSRKTETNPGIIILEAEEEIIVDKGDKD